MQHYLGITSSILMLILLDGCAESQPSYNLISAKANIDVTTDGISVTTIKLDPSEITLSEQIEHFGEPFEDPELVSKFLLEGIHVRRIHSTDSPGIKATIGEHTVDVKGNQLYVGGQLPFTG